MHTQKVCKYRIKHSRGDSQHPNPRRAKAAKKKPRVGGRFVKTPTHDSPGFNANIGNVPKMDLKNSPCSKETGSVDKPQQSVRHSARLANSCDGAVMVKKSPPMQVSKYVQFTDSSDATHHSAIGSDVPQRLARRAVNSVTDRVSNNHSGVTHSSDNQQGTRESRGRRRDDSGVTHSSDKQQGTRESRGRRRDDSDVIHSSDKQQGTRVSRGRRRDDSDVIHSSDKQQGTRESRGRRRDDSDVIHSSDKQQGTRESRGRRRDDSDVIHSSDKQQGTRESRGRRRDDSDVIHSSDKQQGTRESRGRRRDDSDVIHSSDKQQGTRESQGRRRDDSGVMDDLDSNEGQGRKNVQARRRNDSDVTHTDTPWSKKTRRGAHISDSSDAPGSNRPNHRPWLNHRPWINRKRPMVLIDKSPVDKSTDSHGAGPSVVRWDLNERPIGDSDTKSSGDVDTDSPPPPSSNFYGKDQRKMRSSFLSSIYIPLQSHESDLPSAFSGGGSGLETPESILCSLHNEGRDLSELS